MYLCYFASLSLSLSSLLMMNFDFWIVAIFPHKRSEFLVGFLSEQIIGHIWNFQFFWIECDFFLIIKCLKLEIVLGITLILKRFPGYPWYGGCLADYFWDSGLSSWRIRLLLPFRTEESIGLLFRQIFVDNRYQSLP